jgi:hypothetical protein
MTFETNLKIFKRFILNNGWFLEAEDESYHRYNNIVNVRLNFPQIKNDPDYPRVLMILFQKVERNNPDILKQSFFCELKSQCKNLKQKFSKEKKDWILLEPYCKYHYSEVPEIYIPKSLYLGQTN